MRGFCEQCGKPIAAKRYIKYCTDACKMKAYRRRHDAQVGTPARNKERLKSAVQTKAAQFIEQACIQCGQMFSRDGNQPLQDYCSKACKQKAYRARKKEIAGVWQVGDKCLTENGYQAKITRIDGTRYARTEELINGRWLPGMRSLKKLRPLAAEDVPSVPSFKVGDIVEVTHQTSFLKGHTGRVLDPSNLPEGAEKDNVSVYFEDFGSDGRSFQEDFSPYHLTLVKSIEKQDAEFDNLLRSFGWSK